MQVRHEFKHDAKTVFNILTDADFLKKRAIALGSIDANCNINGLKITLVRQREIKVPAVLSAFLNKVQTATTSELWRQQDDGFNCDNSTEIDGAPLSINGNINLVPSANGCLFTANFETKAKIIFGKGKLQKYAGRTIAKELELECQYTDDYLSSL